MKHLFKSAIVIIAFLSILFTTSCEKSGDNEIHVIGVSLNKTAVVMSIGDTLRLKYNIQPETATNQNVTWKSSNESVATVSDGVVVVHANGMATITITTVDGAKTAACLIEAGKYFPDEYFRAELLKLGMTETTDGDIDPTTPENQEAIKNITTFLIADVPAISLKGIEYLKAITDLTIFRTEITELDLAGNSMLTTLHCSFNNMLSELDISSNNMLNSVKCNDNKIANLDLKNLSGLEVLVCDRNNLTSLDVSNNLLLNQLTCNNNQIVALNVSSNSKLDMLRCENNLISQLNVSTNILLKDLSCSFNKIKMLDVSANTALNVFRCSNNMLEALNISTLEALNTIVCGNQNGQMTLSLTSEQKTSWDNFWSRTPANANVILNVVLNPN